jgi:DNA-binding response OmpR family regulator
LLISNQDRFIEKNELQNCIWDWQDDSNKSKTIESYLSRIRRKLEKLHPDLGKSIVNQRRGGWRFVLPEID